MVGTFISVTVDKSKAVNVRFEVLKAVRCVMW
jgi:hypothetical protein